MPLSHEHLGSKIPAKIQIYTLTRAELLITLCYEIPCIIGGGGTDGARAHLAEKMLLLTRLKSTAACSGP